MKSVDSDGPVDHETITMKVQDKSDIVDGSSENVHSKVVCEITSVQSSSESENHSDTSADESEPEEVSHSRTLTDNEKEDAPQHEWKKKLTKVKVKIEPEDSSYEMVNVQIKNEDDQSNSIKSMSSLYGDTKEEEEVKNTEWVPSKHSKPRRP